MSVLCAPTSSGGLLAIADIVLPPADRPDELAKLLPRMITARKP